jgi:Mn-dependent DtxR family transcriptional regulator
MVETQNHIPQEIAERIMMFTKKKRKDPAGHEFPVTWEKDRLL